MSLNNVFSAIILASALFITAQAALASPPSEGEGHSTKHHQMDTQQPMKGHHDKMAHHGKMGQHKSKEKKGHHGTFTSHWAKTLSDKQKLLVDRMHVDVAKQLTVLKAQKQVKKAELENVIVNDQYDQAAAYALIDEMAKIKAKMLKVRYDHVAEMRTVLTEEQRLSYDMDRFKNKKHGGK